jgi:hypothetical protein
MRRGLVLAAMCAALVSSCSQPEAALKLDPTAKFSTDLPMNEFMGHVVDPAAFLYWRGSGYEITAEGERDLSPTTVEGWEALETGAATLIEAGNAMQLPGRVRAPEADWNKWSQLLSTRAVAAKEAAFKKDKQAVFDEGGRVSEVCTSCHQQFVIDPAS